VRYRADCLFLSILYPTRRMLLASASIPPPPSRYSPSINPSINPSMPPQTSEIDPRSRLTLQDVENETKRRLIIATAIRSDNLAKCDAQASSLLFQLPQEIRDLIFGYASSSSDGKSYPETAYYFRPGNTASDTVPLDWLLTCRRI